MEKSISFCKGRGSLAHNNRVFTTPNVNSELTPNNIAFVQMPLKKAYENCFKESIDDYNARQKRSDRRIDGVDGYMFKLEHSGNGEKLFYESVVQVGNMFDTHIGSEDAETAVEVLKDYVNTWNERNPNLYLFNAVLHLDEQTPHLHLDYIPLASGYSRGLNVRNSLDRALKQQGIAGKSGKTCIKECSTIKWQEREKDEVERLMRSRGLERKTETGLHRSKKSVEDYKLAVSKVDAEIEMRQNIEIQTQKVPLMQGKVIVNENELDDLKDTAKPVDYRNEQLSHLILDVEKKRVDAGNSLHSAYSLEEQAKQAYNSQIGVNDKCKQLDSDNRELKDEVANLVFQNDLLEQENCELRNDVAVLNKKIKDLELEHQNVVDNLQKQVNQLTSKLDVLQNKCANLGKCIVNIVQAVKWTLEKKLTPGVCKLLDACVNYGSEQVKVNYDSEVGAELLECSSKIVKEVHDCSRDNPTIDWFVHKKEPVTLEDVVRNNPAGKPQHKYNMPDPKESIAQAKIESEEWNRSLRHTNNHQRRR